jgi:hypothetical protein
VARLGGRLVSDADLEALIGHAQRNPARPYVDSIAVDIDENLVPAGHTIHFGNHSCDPNLWHLDTFTLGTRRQINADEELTIDYATQTANPGFWFRCRCGSPRCRHKVTGDDWRLPALKDRYGGHWVPVLRHCIGSVAVAQNELVFVRVDPRDHDARIALARYLDETAHEHKVGILKTGAIVLAVAAVPATGGTSLALAAGAVGLNVAAEALDNRPCEAQRVEQAAALGFVGGTVGVLWAGAAEAAGMAGDLGSQAVANWIGRGAAAGNLLSFLAPTPTCSSTAARC